MRLTRAEFADLVVEALADIPEPLAQYMRDVAVDIERMPDRRTCRDLGVSNPGELLGFYRGTPLTERSVQQSMRFPDHIIIYQRNIERLCRNRDEVVRQIRKTVFHEIGHHFGLDEDDLAELGYA
jgi:predicted Zn-dependent protease with MMP-like domain